MFFQPFLYLSMDFISQHVNLDFKYYSKRKQNEKEKVVILTFEYRHYVYRHKTLNLLDGFSTYLSNMVSSDEDQH